MPAAIDLSPFTKLHALIVLRDLIRKWWKLELFLVDEQGLPVGPGKGPASDGAQRNVAPSIEPATAARTTPAAPVAGNSAPPGLPAQADPAPVNLTPSRPIARDNDFCRLSLHAPLGARRCADSLRVTLARLGEAGRGSRTLVHECHLGFDIVACSIWLDGAIAGYVAVSGSIHENWTAFGESQLLRKVNEVAPAAGAGTDLERALRRVPFLSVGEMEQLTDLLSLCADEIQAHHQAVNQTLRQGLRRQL